MKVNQSDTQEEWVNVLSKGLITIPKKMRDEVGIKEGDVVGKCMSDSVSAH